MYGEMILRNHPSHLALACVSFALFISFYIRPRCMAAIGTRRRERGKRRNADTNSAYRKPTAFTQPYQNHPSLISRFIF